VVEDDPAIDRLRDDRAAIFNCLSGSFGWSWKTKWLRFADVVAVGSGASSGKSRP